MKIAAMSSSTPKLDQTKKWLHSQGYVTQIYSLVSKFLHDRVHLFVGTMKIASFEGNLYQLVLHHTKKGS